MPEVVLEDVSLTFPDGTAAVSHVDLAVGDGELVTLLGPSGCGKTSILRLIAGLERPDEGTITIGGTVANDLAPRHRNVAMVFQHDALYEHLTAGANMAFPLHLQRLPENEVESRVARQAEELGIGRVLGRRPNELSAGHRQAVAAGRALVRDTSRYLLDEPLALLDAASRTRIRSEISRLHRRLDATMLYVTNDQAEAMALGDRVAVLRDGRLQQIAGPADLYGRPANMFVAGFVGSPPMNLVACALTDEDGELWIALGDDRVRLGAASTVGQAVRARSGSEVVVGIRPEHAGPAGPGTPFDRCVHGAAVAVEHLGAEVWVHAAFGGVSGGSVDFIARYPPDPPVHTGDRLEMAIRTDKLSFFDPATGRAL